MLSKQFPFREREHELYDAWEQSGAFAPTDSPRTGNTYCIPMPPPNANGSLHLGHASMLAYQDILIRYHRMKGDAALWIPGTDHAGIQTQVVFEKHLQETKGLSRHDLGRDEFYDQCFAFSMENKSTITGQVRKMGASCDWSREKFTLDDELLDVVYDTFIQLHKDGLVYRANRIIHWCPRCQTSLSNIEVVHKDTPTTLYYIKYGPLTLATVRPETKFGDTALAVHPDDARYKEYVGKTITVDSILDEHVEIRVIADDAVDSTFGTGVIKVTPAHDPLDYEIGERHGLEVKQVIDKDGRLTELAGKYAGMIASEARDLIAADMEAKGLIVKTEEYSSPLSVCERCKTPIEPLISLQWYIKMKPLAERGLQALEAGDVQILPDRFRPDAVRWIENLHDWNISRQLWWGPRLPIWYCDECEEVHVQREAPSQCEHCGHASLSQDEDTFDTWFSSGQWPYSILGGPGSAEFDRFYPTNVLETGFDILYFWVTRMIMLGLYRTDKVPFFKTYLHGLILDKDGQKMSKSKGNGIDPLEMSDKYGTDALRMSMVTGVTPGQNLRLYEEKIEQYRNFVTKLWNVARFVEYIEQGHERPDHVTVTAKTPIDHWILSRLDVVTRDVTDALDEMQFGDASSLLYDFLWKDVADWYVEAAKIQMSDDALQTSTLSVLHHVLRTTLTLLHPFIPFVTEQLWQELGYDSDAMLIFAAWPDETRSNDDALSDAPEDMHAYFGTMRDLISRVRELRGELGIDSSKHLGLELIEDASLTSAKEFLDDRNHSLITALASVELSVVPEKDEQTNMPLMIVDGMRARLILDASDKQNVIELLSKRIEHDTRAIAGFEKKLNNPQFVEKAPSDVVESIRQKRDDRKRDLEQRTTALESLRG